MKKIEYSYGGGVATIFLHLNEGEIYNTGVTEDLLLLLGKYPASKNYYSSRSGKSGAGYLSVPNEQIFISLPVYRDGITYLSEAHPSNVNGTTIMVPTSLSNKNQDSWESPGVARIYEKLIFLFSIDNLIKVIENENIPPIEGFLSFSYKYFSISNSSKLEEDEINGKYSLLGKEYLKPKSIRGNLPYPLADFHKLFFSHQWDDAYSRQEEVYEVNGDLEMEEQSPMEQKLRVEKGANNAYLKKKNGFISEIIPLGEYSGRFTETPYDWCNGWSTIQGMAWKIREENVFVIFCDKKKNFSFRFSEMEGWEEYENSVSVFEWVKKSPQEWRNEMKKNAHTKLNNEYLSALRWKITSEKSKDKVRELLTLNTETQIFVSDSLATGNCEYGTKQFMSQLNLKDGMTCAEFLAHSKIEEILENNRFKVTILQKFGGLIEDGRRVSGSRRRRGNNYNQR